MRVQLTNDICYFLLNEGVKYCPTPIMELKKFDFNLEVESKEGLGRLIVHD